MWEVWMPDPAFLTRPARRLDEAGRGGGRKLGHNFPAAFGVKINNMYLSRIKLSKNVEYFSKSSFPFEVRAWHCSCIAIQKFPDTFMTTRSILGSPLSEYLVKQMGRALEFCLRVPSPNPSPPRPNPTQSSHKSKGPIRLGTITQYLQNCT